MALSTDIPSAILNTMMVDGLIGIPAKPIMAAVISSGIILGIIDTRIMRNEENNKAMSSEINKMAIPTLSNRFLIRKLVPFAYTTLLPVSFTLNLAGSKMLS